MSFTGAATTTTLLTNVKQVQDGAPPSTGPSSSTTATRRACRRATSSCSTTPLATANLGRVALIKIAFRSFAIRPIADDGDSTELENDVFIRISDPTEVAGRPAMHLIHRCQQGFTTVTLMGVLMVGGMLVAASFAAVDPDIGLSQKDDDSKQAYAAAEAGISYYLNRLAQDSSYYTHCANVPSATQNAVNIEWSGTGADPRRFRKIPGYQSDYAVELLAVQTAAAGTELCVENVPGSMIDASTGSFRIRVDRPRAHAAQRQRHAEEAQHRGHAAAQGLPRLPLLHRPRDARPAGLPGHGRPGLGGGQLRRRRARTGPSGCTEINFITQDAVNGPAPLERQHPRLRLAELRQRRRRRDRAEPGRARAGCPAAAAARPTSSAPLKYPGGILPMPQSNAELEAAADAGYVFSGETTIVLNGNSMNVTNNGSTVSEAAAAERGRST